MGLESGGAQTKPMKEAQIPAQITTGRRECDSTLVLSHTNFSSRNDRTDHAFVSNHTYTSLPPQAKPSP
jgi:hypothetical protein